MILTTRTRDYRVRMPADTTVPAACEQVRCENWLYGWDTPLDLRDPEHARLAEWFRSGRSGRSFTELAGGGAAAVFRFEAGQRCFSEHRTRPGRLLVSQGGQVREHTRTGDFIEDIGGHLDRLAELDKRG